MIAVQTVITLIPAWLISQASSFSPSPSTLPPTLCTPPLSSISATTTVVLQLSQSANDNMGGFHYDQEPRGTSYISQISKQDLWERRNLKRPLNKQRRQRRPAPNSRGAVPQGQYQQYQEGEQQYIPIDDDDEDDEDEFDDFKDNVSTNLKSMTDLLKEMHRSQSSQSTDVQALTFKVADMAERLGRTEQAKKNHVSNAGENNRSPSSSAIGEDNDFGDKNFGTSLDGKFNRQIKDVFDEFDMVVDAAAAAAASVNKNRDATTIGNNGNNGSTGGNGPRISEKYYASAKSAQLEAKINSIDETLQSIGDSFNTQMEHMALSVNQRLEDIEDASSFDAMPPPLPPQFDNGMQFQQPQPPQFQQQPPPPPEQFLEDRPPPPPMQQPMQMPHPQERYPDNLPYNMDDNGRTYYQERNYNEEPNNVVPPPPQHIPSSQNQHSTQSINTNSEGHQYKDMNTSFISSFSKADNEQRRRFQPFRDPRRNQVGMREQLPRGVGNVSNRRSVFELPPPMVQQQHQQSNYMPDGMTDDRRMGPEQYYYEEGMMMGENNSPMMMEDQMMMVNGPMMMEGQQMMEEEYFYNDDGMY